MFKKLTTTDNLLELQRANASLKAALDKATADLEYTAMMCDIELDTEEVETDEQI